MRKVRNLAIIVAVVVAIFFFIKKTDVFSPLKDLFSSKPATIDETPILIKEIKSIGQLITYTAYDEVVVDSVITTKAAVFVNSLNRLLPFPLLPSGDKQIVLIARGRILAGVDLASLSDTAITLKKDTLRLFMPKAKILDAIVNPSDFETFIEKGNWSGAEVTGVKIKARNKMTQRALQQNILQKSDTRAKEIMTNFLGNMGYKRVLIF